MMGLGNFFSRSLFNIRRWTNRFFGIAYDVVKASIASARPQAFQIIFAVVRGLLHTDLSGADKRTKALEAIKDSFREAQIAFSSFFVNLWLEIFANFMSKVKNGKE